jgi:hypothetical protein
MLRGQERVPCQVVQADRAKQAAAYAAVNGNVTQTKPQALYWARVTAGEAEATRIRDVCAAADVNVIRRNLSLAKMKRGDTLAVGAIAKCIDKFGPKITITALQCLTRTADGNAGFLRATIIEAIALVLQRNPDWCESGEKLLRTLDKWSWPDQWGAFTEGLSKHATILDVTALAQRIEKFLSKQFEQTARRKAA